MKPTPVAGAHTHPHDGACDHGSPDLHDHGNMDPHDHDCAEHDHDTHDHGHDDHGHDHAGHDHDHEGHGLFGHHHHHAPGSFGNIFAIGMVLNTVYLIAEAIYGILGDSLALLADAGHNLSDVMALGAAWLAHTLGQRAPSSRFTYGLKRTSILAALSNAVILLVVTGGIAWEAILRLFHPAPVAGLTVALVAAAGILVNGGTALLFLKGQKDDLNIRGAFLHMASDALASLAVVITGGLVMLTGLFWLDPTISLLISVLIVVATWKLLRDSLDMALDGVPRSVDIVAVEETLLALPGIGGLHDLHVWPISTTETALTVHLVRQDDSGPDNDHLLKTAGDILRTRFGIIHPTLQIEQAPCTNGCALGEIPIV